MTDIPKLGLGTWQNTKPEECKRSVEKALNMGYKHIDTAQAYDNEEYVGNGLEAANVDRKDFFLASKVWIDNLSPTKVVSSTEESMRKLGVDKIDLMYIHWPAGDYNARKTLESFKDLVEDGKIGKIGISNFRPDQVDEAMEIAGEHIIANQVEMHPLLKQEELLKKCREHDIDLVAYSPLARGKVFDIPLMREIANKHDVSPAQVSLAWLMQKENVKAIPKASSEEHIRDNFGSLDLQLDDEDVERIDSLEKRERVVDPGFAPW